MTFLDFCKCIFGSDEVTQQVQSEKGRAEMALCGTKTFKGKLGRSWGAKEAERYFQRGRLKSKQE